MQWVRANSADFGGTLPQPRSGHSAVNVGKSLVVVFGGLVDKRFISDIAVYDVANRLWFTPQCTGNESDEQVGPCPRAFHVAAAIGCHMFVFGGRYASKRLGDFWMLDTEIWQWSQLTCFGDLPSPRDFAAASVSGNQKLVMYGGWDGKKWLSDVYVLDTITLEWMELSISGAMPTPRCGHTANMVEKRLLVFGGRGGGGPIMGDLWALKGLYEGENESPGWTQLKLPGQSPSPRCGHTVTSGGLYLLLFGGHGTGGWLSRYDIYHNDCIILDRVSAQWKRLTTSNELPPARAYHSMISVGSRYMLFGGFDGKSTFGDIWWLVPEDDPIARRSFPVAPLVSSNESKDASVPCDLPYKSTQYIVCDTEYMRRQEEFSLSELVKKLGISVSAATTEVAMVNELNDREFLELCSRIAGEPAPTNYQAIREHWKNCEARTIQLKELGPLFRDYQRLITRKLFGSSNCLLQFAESQPTYQYYHLQSASQLRMADVEKLLSEYRQLLSS